MKKLLFTISTGILLGLSVGLTSCSDDNNCSIVGRSMVNCTIKTINPETEAIENDTIKSLTITALGTDSIILNRAIDVTSLSLPLSYVSDTTILVLHYDYEADPKIADTLYIKQKNIPFFESMECGYSMLQSIIEVTCTKNQLNSVSIINNTANTNGTENLRLFYRYSN